MKIITALSALCLLIIVSMSATAAPIIADHNAVDAFNNGDIPDYWISEAKKLFASVPGESHSRGLYYGLNNLEAVDSQYAVSNSVLAPTDQELRFRNTMYISGAWTNAGEEDTWTTQAAVDRTQSFFDYQRAQGYNLNLFAFGWCWDMCDDGFDAATGWGGRAFTDFYRTNPVHPWDISTTTPNLNDYLQRWQTLQTNNPDITIAYSTGPVDSGCAVNSYNYNNGHQRFLKHEAIRNWVESSSDYVLWDYADILTHDSTGNCTYSWTDTAGQFGAAGTVYDDPTICNSNLVPEYQGHISLQGTERLAKAFWWLLARQAGWNGVPGNTNPPAQGDTCNSVGWAAQGYSQCEEIDSCRTLDQANTYYLLNQSVTSAGTCFSLTASNLNINLNGHTINFAQSQIGIGVSMETISDIAIHNGNISGGYFPTSTAITTNGEQLNHNLEFYNLNISVQGQDSEGIYFWQGDNLLVHDNNIIMNSPKSVQCNHNGHLVSGIYFLRRGGDIQIYNNNITGNGNQGINIASCGNWNPSTPTLIFNNYISMFSDVGDGFAIGVLDNSGGCSDGTKIFNNTINQINGRGIAVAGGNVGSDHGPGNYEIFENNITVRETCQCEYDTGTGAGMRIRFGAHDIYVHDNEIYGSAGLGVQTCPGILNDGGRTIGLYVGNSLPYGLNNVYENNYIDVNTITPGSTWYDYTYSAVGIYTGGLAGNDASRLAIFRNNTIRTNNQGIRLGYDDGAAGNALFDSNTIIQAANPINFRTISAGYDLFGAVSVELLDTIGLNGADPHQIAFDAADGILFDDINISWTLTVNVTDDSGNPLNASVQVIDIGENILDTGTTVNGIYSNHFTEISYFGLDPNVVATSHTPHNVSVTYNGDTQIQEIVLDNMKTLNFTFSTGPTCPLPYDIPPTCGCIDIGELGQTISGWYTDQIGLNTLMLNIKSWKNCN